MADVSQWNETTTAPGEAIRVRGLVQGVGFRPMVWRLARACGLSGTVANDSEGVLIRIWGEPGARQRFVERLRTEAPPLARIEALERTALHQAATDGQFQILASQSGAVHTGVVADAATCDACLQEISDPRDRRHGYAFSNCTHCGPRLSIIQSIPYDRANTSMAAFPLCPECQREYHDPADRRFHAQPNACAVCGPRLWLEVADTTGDHADPIAATVALLGAGRIVAIKGIGGFHLACDASSAEAVARLRQRKRRPAKPFALMARDLAMIRRYCHPNQAEVDLLQSPAAPIVLLPNTGAERLANGIAPKQRCYGFMLPYSPLHHLLMANRDTPLLLTSGNRSEEPQCIDNREAREQLAGVADAWLLHDREIVNRLDDSVARLIHGAPTLLRRARGYAPTPLPLPSAFAAAPELLACGADLKNTFCLLKDGAAILSQHLGDLENPIAHGAYQQTLARYQALFEHRPRALAVDSHPGYFSSRLGRQWVEADGLPLFELQHHHAHIAACLADNQIGLHEPPVLGIALDGSGHGDDNTLWGGELLLADYRKYRRLGRLAMQPLPGGAQAIRQPWRLAYAHLRGLEDWPQWRSTCADLSFFRHLASQPLATLDAMIESGLNTPWSSSCGRLFDAVAALLGLCQEISYEGQAAIELEAAVDQAALEDGFYYPFTISHEDGLACLQPLPMWRALLEDLYADVATGVMAARFHSGLVQALVRLIEHLGKLHNDPWQGRIALSGGVFQNAVLSDALIRQLESRGLTVLRHTRVPANDGGLSLGQAVIAAARLLAEPHHS